MKIIHCFRTPVADVFRHVLDLVPEQAQAGHEIGILCDSITGGQQAIDQLNSIHDFCSLGIHRIEIRRNPSLFDLNMLHEDSWIFFTNTVWWTLLDSPHNSVNVLVDQ